MSTRSRKVRLDLTEDVSLSTRPSSGLRGCRETRLTSDSFVDRNRDSETSQGVGPRRGGGGTGPRNDVSTLMRDDSRVPWSRLSL